MTPVPNKHLILIGMMGSGKSSIARRLSKQRHFALIDTDSEIEKGTGKTIPALFSEKGENGFREIEHQVVLKALETPDRSIISTGGGAVIRPDNLESMLDNGFVVYLKAEPETLFERVARDPNRPLLQQEDPLGVLRMLLQQRAPFYEKAHLTIQVDHSTCQQICNRIWSHFSKKNPV